MAQFGKNINAGQVALACSVIGIAGRWIVLGLRPERGISRVASQGGLESSLMTGFILLAGVGLVVGVVALFKRPSRWWGLGAIAVTVIPLVYLMFNV